ncbi:MAG: 5-(carboxyamino)imidazole ribonucleotide synthase [Candidatus Binatia bacterium]
MTTVGVLGGGQLARMLAIAGLPLGIRLRVFDPAADVSASVLAEHVRADWGDTSALSAFCDGLDLATVEFESVPVSAARHVAARVPMRPSPEALAAAQDRLAEKELARTLGIATPRFVPVDDEDDLEAALDGVGAPAILKRRRGGYDGRGQAVVRSAADLSQAWSTAGGAPCILESFESFDREVSQVAVRALDGSIAFYPLVENLHEGGVLRRSIAPAPRVGAALRRRAREITRAILETLQHVGVIAVEFFVCGDELRLNEIAPRVHNSGHWTIEGAATSQFENHLRAITGLPLGATHATGVSLLYNILGTPPTPARILGVRGASLHLYGKSAAPGRKLGHVTIHVASPRDLPPLERRLIAALGPEELPEAVAVPGGAVGP